MIMKFLKSPDFGNNEEIVVRIRRGAPSGSRLCFLRSGWEEDFNLASCWDHL